MRPQFAAGISLPINAAVEKERTLTSTQQYVFMGGVYREGQLRCLLVTTQIRIFLASHLFSKQERFKIYYNSPVVLYGGGVKLGLSR
jgi:hypothetical protein